MPSCAFSRSPSTIWPCPPSSSRSHQRLVGDLYVLRRAYVERNRLGEAVFSPATVRLAPNTRFEPDVFVIPAVDGRRPPIMDPVTNLLLAAEPLRIDVAQFFAAASDEPR